MKKIFVSVLAVSLFLFFLSIAAFAATVPVSIVDNAFSPQNITINVGDTVVWTNNGFALHTATSGTTCPTGNQIWDSGFLSTGQFFEFTFTQPGNYSYFCTIHCFTGTVTVNAVTPTMPAPVGQQSFFYLPVVSPVANISAAASRPVGVGSLAAGGDLLTVQVQTVASAVPLDHYLAFQWSADLNTVVNIMPDGTFQNFSYDVINQALLTGIPPAGLVPWKANTAAAINETPFVNVPSADLGAGTYYIFFVSAIPGSLNNFYSWENDLTIGVPLSVTLSGSQEVPPVATAATGTANLAVNFATGGIFGDMDFSGLSSNSTASHIHLGAAGVNGDIIIPLTGGAGGTSGEWIVPDGAVLTADQLVAFMNDQLYANIHSANFLGGEIRGQMTFPDIELKEELTGAQEVSAVATSATGIADFFVNISTGEITGTVTFSGLSSNSTASHIHLGAVGVNGSIIIPLAGGGGGTSGTWSVPPGTFLTAAWLTALSSNQLYVNVHSANFGSGEIRSQLYYPRGAPAL